MPNTSLPISALALTAVAALAGCANMGSAPMGGAAMSSQAMYSQAALPDAVKVPAGFKVALETVGKGDITYECRVKATVAGEYEWFFAGPNATLSDRGGKAIGKYYGPPATWEAMDGSKITGTQLAVAPSGMGNIPSQLVKANPAMGSGAMTGVSHIQRVATKGGVAPATPCANANLGQKQVVPYQADYIFYTAM